MRLHKPQGHPATKLDPTSGEFRATPCGSLRRKGKERGSSIIEIALLAPWIFFLFVGVFDFGFYAYAAICTQNAARAVAVAAAATATAGITPCSAALGEMRMLPNVGYNPVFACGNGLVVTNANPVAACVGSLTYTSATAVCGLPAARMADYSLQTAGSTATSMMAEVTYQTIPLVPIPGILTGRVKLTRVAEVRVITP